MFVAASTIDAQGRTLNAKALASPQLGRVRRVLANPRNVAREYLRANPNVVGFNQTTKQHVYTVNENFGVLQKAGNPYQIQLSVRYGL